MNRTIVDLGWANGWGKTPDAITKAEQDGYEPVETYHSERGESRYRLETKDTVYIWRVDSSD